MHTFIDYLIDESKWFTVSVCLSFVVSVSFMLRPGHSFWGIRVPVAMNLITGITIGFMGFGHLMAVGYKHLTRTLQGSPLLLYTIGISLVTPSFWLVFHGINTLKKGLEDKKKSVGLNLWTIVALLVLGIPNIPLAFPAILNVFYNLSKGRHLKMIILVLFCIVFLGLLIGSVSFFMSGQTFEQFRGLNE